MVDIFRNEVWNNQQTGFISDRRQNQTKTQEGEADKHMTGSYRSRKRYRDSLASSRLNCGNNEQQQKLKKRSQSNESYKLDHGKMHRNKRREKEKSGSRRHFGINYTPCKAVLRWVLSLLYFIGRSWGMRKSPTTCNMSNLDSLYNTVITGVTSIWEKEDDTRSNGRYRGCQKREKSRIKAPVGFQRKEKSKGGMSDR